MKHVHCVLLTLMFLAATLSPALVRAAPWPDDWRLQGEGEMRWFGLSLYQARLWVPPRERFPLEGTPEPGLSFALELRYARDFDGDRLAGASIDELRRLGWADKSQLERWGVELAKVFPNVKQGEVIVGRHLAGGAAEFFHQGQRTGRIDDPQLATAFFAIWLDPRTREPQLRARLLGGS